MAIFRPFRAVRPAAGYAEQVAQLPYDVMNSEEARVMAEDRPWDFLHVDRAEIDFPRGIDLYSDEVYAKAAENLNFMREKGILVEEASPCYYIYREIMNGRAQTGIVGCASVDEYLNNTIKKHEFTVEVKERDRIRHVDTCDANTGVIFLTMRDTAAVVKRMNEVADREDPLYDFTREDGVRHIVWRIDNPDTIALIERAFGRVPNLYIADGHHRTASAVKVALKRRKQNPSYTGDEEFNFFLAAVFPASSLQIIDYNRVVKDLNGLSEDAFLAKLRNSFSVKPLPEPWDDSEEALEMVRPKEKHCISMLLHGKWYELKALPSAYDPADPVRQLDVSILQERVLTPVLNIKDPRTDGRISFVGGIRGLKELVRLTDEGAELAFAMYPTSMEELMNVADAGKIMPPKSTWFEPKLLSGLFIHPLS